jgi:hypothetical protein
MDEEKIPSCSNSALLCFLLNRTQSDTTVNKSNASVGIVFGVVASILVVGAIGFLLFKKWKSGKNSKQPAGHNNQNFQIE